MGRSVKKNPIVEKMAKPPVGSAEPPPETKLYTPLLQGWLKSAILGGSSYKDLGLSLGGSSYKEINPVPEAARNRI